MCSILSTGQYLPLRIQDNEIGCRVRSNAINTPSSEVLKIRERIHWKSYWTKEHLPNLVLYIQAVRVEMLSTDVDRRPLTTRDLSTIPEDHPLLSSAAKEICNIMLRYFECHSYPSNIVLPSSDTINKVAEYVEFMSMIQQLEVLPGPIDEQLTQEATECQHKLILSIEKDIQDQTYAQSK